MSASDLESKQSWYLTTPGFIDVAPWKTAVSLWQLTLQHQSTLMQGCSAWHNPASPSVIVQGGATPECDVTLC